MNSSAHERWGKPWNDRPSIYGAIRQRQDRVTGELPNAFVLPDEPGPAADELRWAGGALDSVVGSMDAVPGDAVIKLLRQTIEAPSPRHFAGLYGCLTEHRFMTYAEPVAEAIHGGSFDRATMRELGVYLVTEAADREAVKFGIMLLGGFGDHTNIEKLLTVGAHSEFTLFSLASIEQLGGGVDEIFRLAQLVTGWSRIHCVERLDGRVLDPVARRWLITDGWRRIIMAEYTAAQCARSGGLLEHLSEDPVAADVLDGAAEILNALVVADPGEGMRGYRQGAAAARRFLELLAVHPAPRPYWLLAARQIDRFAGEAPTKQGEAWTDVDRNSARCLYADVLQRPVWTQVISADLRHEDRSRFSCAAAAAPLVGIDPWDARFERLLKGEDQWYWIFGSADEARMHRLLAVARDKIDLASIASGYGNAMGLSAQFDQHQRLDCILQALTVWPGLGEEFILTGLRSPVTRNRVTATKAAIRWPREQRATIEAEARNLLARETHEATKKRLERLVRGEQVVGPDDD